MGVPHLKPEPVPGAPTYFNAEQVARALGVSVEWVRAHAAQLGGFKLDNGARGWRFRADRLPGGHG